jgi:hypothetical protein
MGIYINMMLKTGCRICRCATDPTDASATTTATTAEATTSLSDDDERHSDGSREQRRRTTATATRLSELDRAQHHSSRVRRLSRARFCINQIDRLLYFGVRLFML